MPFTIRSILTRLISYDLWSTKISSYILFTMDKLVAQTTRQLQALLTSDTCPKLLSLFMYETVRPQGMLENVYHASCAELLRDERMFLFEFEQTPAPGRFTIQLLDSSSQAVPRFMEFNFEPSKYSEYVASFQRYCYCLSSV